MLIFVNPTISPFTNRNNPPIVSKAAMTKLKPLLIVSLPLGVLALYHIYKYYNNSRKSTPISTQLGEELNKSDQNTHRAVNAYDAKYSDFFNVKIQQTQTQTTITKGFQLNPPF
jgi:hypothetical protein